VTWSNAPDSELKFDIAAPGLMRTNGVTVRADGQEHVIVLASAVVVSGTVRDASDGHPIPRFKIVTGWPVTNVFDHTVGGRWSNFERDWLTFSDGQFRHSFEDALVYGGPNPGYMLRFQAEGYAPFISRPIQADEAEVRLDVALRVAAETTVTVLLPDNRPATQADVGLVMPQAGLQLVPGGLYRLNAQNGAALLNTDASGNFRLPVDESISRVIVAHSAGFAEVSAAALAADPIIRLEPWGKLEGTYTVSGQPATNRDFLFQYGERPSDPVQSSFEAYRARTDEAGHFVFNQVPPGKHKLVRLIPVGGGGLQHDPVADVDIRPGETTAVNLGGNCYSLSGRLHWPDGWKAQNTQSVHAWAQTAPPPALAALVSSPKPDPAAWAQVQQLPEVQDYARRARHVPVVIANDFQTLSADEVPPGDYILIVSAADQSTASQPPSNRFGAQVSFTVPADPPTGNVDLGEISPQPALGAK